MPLTLGKLSAIDISTMNVITNVGGRTRVKCSKVLYMMKKWKNIELIFQHMKILLMKFFFCCILNGSLIHFYLGKTKSEYKIPMICTSNEAVKGTDENGSRYSLYAFSRLLSLNVRKNVVSLSISPWPSRETSSFLNLNL
jgi:hypothetical protein